MADDKRIYQIQQNEANIAEIMAKKARKKARQDKSKLSGSDSESDSDSSDSEEDVDENTSASGADKGGDEKLKKDEKEKKNGVRAVPFLADLIKRHTFVANPGTRLHFRPVVSRFCRFPFILHVHNVSLGLPAKGFRILGHRRTAGRERELQGKVCLLDELECSLEAMPGDVRARHGNDDRVEWHVRVILFMHVREILVRVLFELDSTAVVLAFKGHGEAPAREPRLPLRR